MKRLLTLSLALIAVLIYSDLAFSQSKAARIIGGVQKTTSGSSSYSSGGGSHSPSSNSGSSGSLPTGIEADSDDKTLLKHNADYYGGETKNKAELQKIKPHPKRETCAELWNAHYEQNDINIKVSARGNYNEQILFICPTCTDEDHFIKPFTESEYQGHSGMDRIKSCGFDYAVFKGGRGFNEVVVEVPKD